MKFNYQHLIRELLQANIINRLYIWRFYIVILDIFYIVNDAWMRHLQEMTMRVSMSKLPHYVRG